MKGFSLALSAIMLPAALYAAGSSIPSAPAEFVAKADPTGLLKATVSFIAPELATDGSPLGSIERIELKRDGKLIHTFNDITPGEECGYTDTSVTNGYACYTAVAYVDDSGSEEASSGTIFVGVDVPLPPKQLKASVGSNKISFTWSKSDKKGENGERVRQDGVTYILEALDDSYEPRQQLAETKGQAYDYFYEVNNGTQDIKRFGIRAYNITGWSDFTYARVIVGAPYYFPYRESFAGGVTRSLSWQEGDGGFSMVTDMSADDDSGSIRCIPAAGKESTSFNLGKVAMANTLNPRMSFRMTGLPEGEKLLVRVARADGAEATLLTIDGPVDDWVLFTIDLSQLKKETFLIPKFQMPGGNEGVLYIDDIRFEDPYSCDLGVRVFAPEKGYGDTEVIVEVENLGLESVNEASVDILTDGILESTLKLTDMPEPGEKILLRPVVRISDNDKGSVEVKAVMHCVFDLNTRNDIASAQIIPASEPNNMGASGVDEIREALTDGIPVYTIDGRRVITGTQAILPAGMYIVNGKKVIIK